MFSTIESEDKQLDEIEECFSFDKPPFISKEIYFHGLKLFIEKKPEWNIKLPAYELQVFLINKIIRVVRVKGVLPEYTNETEQAIRNAQTYSGIKRQFVISDFSGLKHASFSARRRLKEMDDRLNLEREHLFLLPSGILRYMAKMYQIIYPSIKDYVTLVDTMNEGLSKCLILAYPDFTNIPEINPINAEVDNSDIIKEFNGSYILYKNTQSDETENALNSSVKEELKSTLANLPKAELAELVICFFSKFQLLKNQQKEKCDEILKALSNIKWNRNAIETKSCIDDQNDPFYDLFNTITFLQKDIKEVLDEKIDSNLALEELIDDRTRELKVKKANLNLLIENTIDPIAAIDRNLNLITANNIFLNQFEKKYGKKIQLGENIFSNIDQEDKKLWIEFCKKGLQGNRFKVSYKDRIDDKEIYNEATFNPIIDEHEKIIGVSFFVKDVSNSKRREAELKRRNKQMQQLNDELDKFVYSASHDIRGPLASLLGLIRLAKYENDIINNSFIADVFNKMTDSVKKLDFILRDIIDYSMNNRMKVKSQMVNLEELIKEVIEGLNFHQGFNEINKIIKIDDGIYFRSDADRLKVIFRNLICNAIKFKRDTCSNSYIKIIINKIDSRLKIEVIDNGAGIPKEHTARIFDMYYKASASKSGSGLGLYITKETLRRLKGTIKVTSSINKGTTFLIEIPEKIK